MKLRRAANGTLELTLSGREYTKLLRQADSLNYPPRSLSALDPFKRLEQVVAFAYGASDRATHGLAEDLHSECRRAVTSRRSMQVPALRITITRGVNFPPLSQKRSETLEFSAS